MKYFDSKECLWIGPNVRRILLLALIDPDRYRGAQDE